MILDHVKSILIDHIFNLRIPIIVQHNKYIPTHNVDFLLFEFLGFTIKLEISA